jgi:methyltransferase (TIGR00027 family)
MAVYRARESERSDAHFRDPFARALAGDRGPSIAAATATRDRTWFFTARTVLFDRFIAAEVSRGVDLVINLAAGVDARPYRMALPPSLRWVEVDLPAIIEYKTSILSTAEPRCHLERIPLDLADVDSRRRLFAHLGTRTARALIISEGLIVYLSDDEVGSLATDLGAIPSFERWAADFPSPELLQLMSEHPVGQVVREAGAPFKFAPAEGADFFRHYDWQPVAVESILDTAGRLDRLPLRLKIDSLFPQSESKQTLWSGVCLFERRRVAESGANESGIQIRK